MVLVLLNIVAVAGLSPISSKGSHWLLYRTCNTECWAWAVRHAICSRTSVELVC